MGRPQKASQKISEVFFGESSTFEHLSNHTVGSYDTLEGDYLLRVVGVDLRRLLFIGPPSVSVHKVVKICDPEKIELMLIVSLFLIVVTINLPHFDAARTVRCWRHFSDNLFNVAQFF